MKDSVLLRKSKNGRACKNLDPTAAQSFFCKQKQERGADLLDCYEGKDASEILFEIEKARAKIQPCGDVTVPLRSLEKSCILPKAI